MVTILQLHHSLTYVRMNSQAHSTNFYEKTIDFKGYSNAFMLFKNIMTVLLLLLLLFQLYFRKKMLMSFKIYFISCYMHMKKKK